MSEMSPMEQVINKYFRTSRLPHIWCPGCGNGIVTSALVKAIDKLSLEKNDVAVVSGIGCSSRASGYLDFNTVHSAHGRALPVATGVKLSEPRLKVIVLTGDGDATAIGGNHFIHACRRNIDITVVVYNNNIYGMTGGQMAPTTLIGQTATTCQSGRDFTQTGHPLRMAEIIATLEAPVYVARFALNTPANIMKAKAGIEKAFLNQIEGRGYSFVELLTNCPTNWGVSPEESLRWITDKSIPYFPLGEFKNCQGGERNGK